MNQNPAAADWAATRGEKWAAQLDGMEATLAPVDDPLIHAARLDAAGRIAEVGCGGGATTLALLRRAPTGSVVHGFDISPAVVAAARQRAPAESRGLTFEVADMTTATPEAPYDRVVSRFGVMFFDDPRAAFANLRRWLAPGGRFAFAVWARPADNAWFSTVRAVVAEVVDLPPADPEAPGPFRYAEAERLLALLGQAGFVDLDVRDWRGALPVGGGLPPAEATTFALAAFSSFGEVLAKAGDAAVAEARRALTARFSALQKEGAVWLDARVHVVTGAAQNP